MNLKRRIFTITCVIILSTMLVSGCSPDVPVQVIVVLKPPPSGHPDTGGWGMIPKTDPYPTQVKETFTPEAPLWLGLRLDSRLKTNITFSFITYFNRAIKESVIISSPADLGSHQPGQVFLLQYSAPGTPGSYEVKVYLEDKLAASALFEVSTTSNSTPAVN